MAHFNSHSPGPAYQATSTNANGLEKGYLLESHNTTDTYRRTNLLQYHTHYKILHCKLEFQLEVVSPNQ